MDVSHGPPADGNLLDLLNTSSSTTIITARQPSTRLVSLSVPHLLFILYCYTCEKKIIMRAVLVLLAVATTGTNAFAPSAFSSRRSSSTQVQMSAEGEVSRTGFLKQMAGAAVAATLVGNPFAALAETLPSGVDVKVIKKGDGPIPDIGELAAIRFRAFAGANKIDDIFDTPEPYYTRIGNGGLIKVSGIKDIIHSLFKACFDRTVGISHL
jgi:hypothetical protein